MDYLTMEHKEIPIYVQNLYKWTPYPTVLKHDCDWDIPILENIECPYCCEDKLDNIVDEEEIFIYVDPEGYLWFGESHGIGKVAIMFCPMCGRQLK